ncbi:MAG: hypothetical protein ACRDTG_18620 [Pseudonocardiaceae bacterium]
MSKVDEVRWRLLTERLIQVFQRELDRRAATPPDGVRTDEPDDILLRLAGAVVMLLEWHAMEGNGRCRVRGCTRRRWVPWRRRRTCPIFRTVQFWIGQPIRILAKIGREW